MSNMHQEYTSSPLPPTLHTRAQPHTQNTHIYTPVKYLEDELMTVVDRIIGGQKLP